MQRSQRRLMRVALMSVLVGCGFTPGLPAQSSGSGGSTPAGQGGSGTPGSGGVGLSGGPGNGGSGGTLGSGGGGGDIVIDSGVTTSCGQTNVDVMPEPPDILIVQDKSGSMTEQASGCCCGTAGSTMCSMNVNCTGNNACGAMSKWAQVSAAIDTVVMTTQAMVNWGLIFFGSDSMCGVSATPNVAIAANDYTAISQAYANNTPGSYTPTRTAVDAASAYMATLTDTNPKYLLLATDGLPNCIPGANVGDDDSAGAKTAVMNAATAGFKTFVVGIGNTNGVATLNQLAMAGGEAQVGSADGNSFYEVNSTADLVTALNKIVGMVASCTIPLTGVNGMLEKVAVSAKDANGNTVEVMPDPTNGWSYTDASMTTIVLNGTACSDLQSGALSGFQFIYTCSMGTICIDRKSDGTCATAGP